MNAQWSQWTTNVLDKYKNSSPEDIKADLQSRCHPFAVLMEHWKGDFNISTMIRNANAFNAKEVFYVGKRRYDRRGTVGTHHYTPLSFLRHHDNVLELKEEYEFVVFDNNVERDIVPLTEFEWPKNPLMIFGEEGQGVTDSVLALADHLVEIPQFGSVRSLNVGTSSGIAMYDYCLKSEA